MKTRLALFLTLIFAVASIVPSFAAGDRLALVIGNAKYPDAEAPLKEPVNVACDEIALMDASRRNPLERRSLSFSAGLAPVIAPNGTLVMYSAALSSVISDNGGDHSLFVQ